MSVRSQGILWPYPTDHPDYKIKTCFSQKLYVIWNQISKDYWRLWIETDTNELGHMFKMATMPIYGKNF